MGPYTIKHLLFRQDGSIVDELLTVAQAGKLLGVSQQRVSQLVGNSTFRKHAIGPRFYGVERRQVEEYATTDRKPGPKPTQF